MIDLWKIFEQPAGKAYVANNENAIVLCSSGPTPAAALYAMGDIIGRYEEPVVLATTLYLSDDYYYMSVVISGYSEDF